MFNLLAAALILTSSPSGAKFVSLDTWDLGAEIGLGSRLVPGPGMVWFGRVRAGGLFIRDDLHWSFGLTADLARKSFTTGLQGEVMHIQAGVWVQATIFTSSYDGRNPAIFPGASLAAGFSLFGVELRGTWAGTPELGVFVKLRLPIRHILLALGVK